MNRPKTLPTFDEPPVTQRDRDVNNLTVILVVAAAFASYAIGAIGFFGPKPCQYQALTPACFAALTEEVHLVR